MLQTCILRTSCAYLKSFLSILNQIPQPAGSKLSLIQRRKFAQRLENTRNVDKFHRHAYHDESEKAMNEQIGAELNASYIYLAIASHFGRTEVALPGCYAFFLQMHLEELVHAHNLIRYQNMRGGKVSLCGIQAVENTNWNIQQSLEKGLQMEKDVKDKLTFVVCVAEKHKDYSLADFIVSDYIQEQEKSIQEYARLLQRYKSVSHCGNCQCTDFLFDKELHKIFSKGTIYNSLKFTNNETEFK